MAGFLDNSGDIILDAVITDVGRKRLSEGNFRIAQFALGDDEIGYNLYNKNHPSGSAYYDLEILQAPVFQGMTQANANINYGLLSNTNQQLLYLPTLVINEKVGCSISFQQAGSLYNFAVNPESWDKLVLNNPDGTSAAKTSIALAGSPDYPCPVIESGLNTTDLKGTQANKQTYLTLNNLIDSTFHVYCDSRFITSVMAPPPASGPMGTSIKFTNTSQGGKPLVLKTPTQTTLQLSYYNTFSILGSDNRVVYDPQNNLADTNVSAIAGPRGMVTMLNLAVDPGLASVATQTADDKWVKYGTTVSIGGITYNSIQTMVYVVGAQSSATLQLSVRLLRYVSG